MVTGLEQASAPPRTSSAPATIGDYALIGDCRTVALVSREGSMDWLCLPLFSEPSVFAALLDPVRGGRFVVRPAGRFSSTRRYLPGTNILETTFHCETGSVRLTDLMSIPESPEALHPMREVLRIVEGVAGEVLLEIIFEPRPDYARHIPRVRSFGRLGWRCAWRDHLLILNTDFELRPGEGHEGLYGELRIVGGQKHYLSLSYVKGDIAVIPPLRDHAERSLGATRQWWETWSGSCVYSGQYRDAVLRSALALKLLTYVLSGAVVAAPTTSLPEVIGAGHNWDYRYCWLRDAGLTVRAFLGIGYGDEARHFLSWLLHATRLTWPKLEVLYDVYGRTRLQERELTHLEGYRDSRPVRIGNAACAQTQLDVYGEVILAAFDYVMAGGHLQRDETRLLTGLGRTVCRLWRNPDHGIWERRGLPRHYTFSKVMCWLALDRLIQLHEKGVLTVPVSMFRRERDALRELIETRGFRPELSSYVSELDGDRMDASLLLMGCFGYKQAGEPSMKGTYQRIYRRLARNGLLLRNEDSIDGPTAGEGAFGVCSFWAIDNLARRGDIDDAKRCFEHVLSFANDVGLFAEEIDPQSGAALGNFPQAFTHVGLINAAVALARSDAG